MQKVRKIACVNASGIIFKFRVTAPSGRGDTEFSTDLAVSQFATLDPSTITRIRRGEALTIEVVAIGDVIKPSETASTPVLYKTSGNQVATFVVTGLLGVWTITLIA